MTADTKDFSELLTQVFTYVMLGGALVIAFMPKVWKLVIIVMFVATIAFSGLSMKSAS